MRIRALAIVLMVLAAAGTLMAVEQKPANTGHIDVRSTLVGGRVYIDDVYSGDADVFIEDVPAGEHSVIIRQGGQVIKGQFTLKPGETMMLEGRFEEGRIVDLKEVAKEEALKRAEAERRAETERKTTEVERKKKEQAKAEEKKKPEQKKAVTAEAKKTQKSAEEERRDLHLNIVRVDFEDAGPSDLKITQKTNAKIITNFNDSKSTTGKLYRNKQHFLLCEGGSCFREWTGRFFYIDETGKRDAFLIRWKETVFTGVTPAGTSKLEMDLCLNGDCKRITYHPEGGGVTQSNLERYVLSWSKNAFIIRRADLLKEITDAGGKVPEY